MQEAIYRVCSLQLRKASRKVEFVPTDSDCFRMTKPLSVIMKMVAEGREDDSLFCTNLMDKYLDRPNIPEFDICLADFVAKYRIIYKKKLVLSSSFCVCECLPTFKSSRAKMTSIQHR